MKEESITKVENLLKITTISMNVLTQLEFMDWRKDVEEEAEILGWYKRPEDLSTYVIFRLPDKPDRLFRAAVGSYARKLREKSPQIFVK